MKIAVIGGGSWGTTLANLFAAKGVDTSLWVREQQLFAEIKSRGENTWYMPGIPLNEKLEVQNDQAKAMEGADVFLFAVPSQFIRAAYAAAREHLPKKPAIVCASKGIERESLATMSEIAEEELGAGKHRFAMLSGPTFAHEVIRGMPSAIVLGCADKKLGKELQELMSTPTFRAYTNPDVKGVELGGAIKNIIAIAAGIADGLGFGSNARAALITRGLAEMGRLGKAMGANPQTFTGLSGMGDLVLTCTGDLSRNRQVGLRLGKGQKLMDILDGMKMVAEGVKTTEAVYELGKKHKVELPITDHVFRILYEEQDPVESVTELMTRDLKAE